MKKVFLTIAAVLCMAIGATFIFGENGDPSQPEDLSLKKAKEVLPYYYKLISHFKEKGYTFWDFHKYLIANKNNLPEKLIVLRHDVHFRDIPNAYYTYVIEDAILGSNVATYYVMLDDIPEENAYNSELRETSYLHLIKYLKRKDVDVQPHISPCDMYIKTKNPWWKEYTKEKLKSMLIENYNIKTDDETLEITVKKKDTLDILDLNKVIIPLLADYNKKWEEQTGIKVESICPHGSHTPMNFVINNATILDQKILRNHNLFMITPHDKIVFKYLSYQSDNEAPNWIEQPNLIKDNRFELLVHPYVWSNIESYRKSINSKDGNIEKNDIFVPPFYFKNLHGDLFNQPYTSYKLLFNNNSLLKNNRN